MAEAVLRVQVMLVFPELIKTTSVGEIKVMVVFHSGRSYIRVGSCSLPVLKKYKEALSLVTNSLVGLLVSCHVM